MCKYNTHDLYNCRLVACFIHYKSCKCHCSKHFVSDVHDWSVVVQTELQYFVVNLRTTSIHEHFYCQQTRPWSYRLKWTLIIDSNITHMLKFPITAKKNHAHNSAHAPFNIKSMIDHILQRRRRQQHLEALLHQFH